MRLSFILSGIAFAAFAIRAAALAQATATVGGRVQWLPVLAMEAANIAAWSLWGIVLVRIARRVVDGVQSRAMSGGIIAGAIVAPLILTPGIIATAHFFTFTPDGSLGDSYRHVLTHNLPVYLLLSLAMMSVALGYLTLARTRRLELTAERLNTDLNRAQLEMLRSQLDPHFLFNSLNSITVLARRGQMANVEQMIAHLAGLLRYSLDSARTQQVPLRVELEALRHYLDIEQIRHGERLVVRIDVPDELSDLMVPSLMLQPIVENAIRHANDPVRTLTVTVTARVDGSRVVMRVMDDGTGIAAEDAGREGVGIGNTKARLAGLYGSAGTLSLSPGADGRGTMVEIGIPMPARGTAA